MRKIVAFLVALLLFAATLVGVNSYYDAVITSARGYLDYDVKNAKLQCLDAVSSSLDENTILFLGSSELDVSDSLNITSHPKNVFHWGNSDFNMMLYGGASNQSLSQAIHLGALGNRLKVKKVVINLSPQWFIEDFLAPEAFADKLYPEMFTAFMENEGISVDLKQRVVDRCKSQLNTSPDKLRQIEAYERVYLHTGNIADLWLIEINKLITSNRDKAILTFSMNPPKATGPKVVYDDIDFSALAEEAELNGQAQCANNDFYVSDNYFKKNLEPNLGWLKGHLKSANMHDTVEYDDLRLLLDICRELGIEPLLVSVPVNGFYYDYTGLPESERQHCYQNIRDIAGEYDVQLLDLSGHEYTPYFLHDIMHLGWKGWIYAIQGVHEFYQQGQS
ncbi:MAG: D-alanyl-lipoteichoic acid biosynthesis protein DltD [Coriobacteriaceae bacterium]|nr:D-alanyl-lipoteichoic acid biosynthesis protein DltD [Coriobacteriaceae bacterium]